MKITDQKQSEERNVVRTTVFFSRIPCRPIVAHIKAIEMEKTTPAPLSVSREPNVFNIAQGPITMDARQEKQTLVSISTTRSSLKSKLRYGIIRRWSIWPKKNEIIHRGNRYL